MKTYIRKYTKSRGALRHTFEKIEVSIIETVINGHRTISGEHPNYSYHYQNLYKVRKIGRKGLIGKIIETPFVYWE